MHGTCGRKCTLFLTSLSDRFETKTKNITYNKLLVIRVTNPIEISETNKQRSPP
jgi:hypothetical protein